MGYSKKADDCGNWRGWDLEGAFVVKMEKDR